MKCIFCGGEFYSSREADKVCTTCERAIERLHISMTPDRLLELAQAEKDGRLVVLPVGVTRAALENDLCVMEQQKDGDAVENYMTGYFKGHKTGRMGLLRLILGVPDRTRQEAEAAVEKGADT